MTLPIPPFVPKRQSKYSLVRIIGHLPLYSLLIHGKNHAPLEVASEIGV